MKSQSTYTKQIKEAQDLLDFLRKEKVEAIKTDRNTYHVTILIKFWEEKLYWMNIHFQAQCDAINSIEMPEGREAII